MATHCLQPLRGAHNISRRHRKIDGLRLQALSGRTAVGHAGIRRLHRWVHGAFIIDDC